MKQVKMFCSPKDRAVFLESIVNSWLASHDTIDIKDKTIMELGEDVWIILWYETNAIKNV